jgi:hypothetical protein
MGSPIQFCSLDSTRGDTLHGHTFFVQRVILVIKLDCEFCFAKLALKAHKLYVLRLDLLPK